MIGILQQIFTRILQSNPINNYKIFNFVSYPIQFLIKVIYAQNVSYPQIESQL